MDPFTMVGCEEYNLFIWVRVEYGIKGNKGVIKFAKKSARILFPSPEPFCGIGKYISKKSFWQESSEMATRDL